MTFKAKYKCESCGIWTLEYTVYRKFDIVGIVCPRCLNNPYIDDILAFRKSNELTYKQVSIYDLFERERESQRKRKRR